MAAFNLPPQQLPFSRKTKEWRKKHIDFVDTHTFSSSSLVRKSVYKQKINYDLIAGKLHMSDLMHILNPDQLEVGYMPNTIPHYPIMNAKLNVLRGEESKRLFDYRVVVTNPNSISKIEEDKKEAVYQRLRQIVSNSAMDEQQYQKELERLSDYFTYDYQDMREVRANALINHYRKEQNFDLTFNEGFVDAFTVGEEIYQCDIVGGEPILRRLNPMKVRVYKSGYSNRIEDADIIALEDYWSPGRIYDTYYEEFEKLSAEDKKRLVNTLENNTLTDSSGDGKVDERDGFVNINLIGEDAIAASGEINPLSLFTDPSLNDSGPYDIAGNIRVLRVYWKSRRKIKKVKSYDPITGEEVYNLYPETYVIDKSKGEEEFIYWINEAWEGTKIGKDIYIGMRPRPIQYNRLSNPSRCHFGIIGSVYNLNDDKPFSLVDIMKQYNYAYDIIKYRLMHHVSNNWGKIVKLDLAQVPKGWDVAKWMNFATTMGLAVIDSFKTGEYGPAANKIAGGLNNASNGVIDAEVGNVIQQELNLLEFIDMEMGTAAGISKQREGQIQNRETVGGVERATLQSSHITEWLFFRHEDVKKRAIECFLETAKIAVKGGSKKFQYILDDGSQTVMDIDGDEFSENDYGLVLDNSTESQEFHSKIDMLAQAALQNQALTFSSIMTLYGTCSRAEKMRKIRNEEQQRMEQQQQQQQMEQQRFEQELQQKAQAEQAKNEMDYRMHTEDNETKILIAEINSQAEADRLALMNKDWETEANMQQSKDELAEKIRQFDAKLKLDNERLAFDKKKHSEELALKDTISKRQAAKASKTK